MARRQFPLLLLFVLVTSVRSSLNTSFQVNNCRGVKLKFRTSWTISLDSHCHDLKERILFHILPRSGQTHTFLYHGYYESYGRSGGTERYEKVLANGTTYQLLRKISRKGDCYWILQRGPTPFFRSKCQTPDNYPPQDGWRYLLSDPQHEEIEVIKISTKSPSYLVRRLNLPKYLSNDYQQMESSITGEEISESSTTLLSQMLHPAVGRSLGEALHQRYTSNGRPIHSITIDGLFNHSLLAQALDFAKV